MNFYGDLMNETTPLKGTTTITTTGDGWDNEEQAVEEGKRYWYDKIKYDGVICLWVSHQITETLKHRVKGLYSRINWK